MRLKMMQKGGPKVSARLAMECEITQLDSAAASTWKRNTDLNVPQNDDNILAKRRRKELKLLREAKLRRR